MHRVLGLAVASVMATSAPLAAEPSTCFEGPLTQTPAFEFQLSKPKEIDASEINLKRSDGQGLDFTSSVFPDTAIERSGQKRSQRTEIRETLQSSKISRASDWLCYEFSVMVPEGTPLPNRERDGKRAKLTVAQFHQERVGSVSPSALMFFDVDPRGHLVFEFSDRLGSRSKLLMKNIRGRWLEIRVAARWSTKRREGRTMVWLRERGSDRYREVIDTKGRNATTGHVYQKLGVYRHNIERDQDFAKTSIEIHYSNIRRNGQPATFR